MADLRLTHTFHGISLTLPEGSEDRSIYRFTLPHTKKRSPQLVRHAAEPAFQENLVLGLQPVAPDTTLAELFVQPNRASLQQTPSFRVLAWGVLEQAAESLAWQDVCFTGPNQMQVFQRQLARLASPTMAAVLVLTSAHKDLDALARTLGLPTCVREA